jgi:hypothetical protein
MYYLCKLVEASHLDQGRVLRNLACVADRGLAERFNAAVLKTVVLERVPGVRIPHPLRSNCWRISCAGRL